MTDDELSSALEEIRARGYRRDQNGAAAFRQSDDAARDVPRLLAAVDAALAHHEKHLATGTQSVCTGCLDAYGEPVEWPCEEYRAITRALTGEDGNGG
jgi:hypothetical protein